MNYIILVLLLLIVLIFLLLLDTAIKNRYTDIVTLKDGKTRINCPFGPFDVVCDHLHLFGVWEGYIQKEFEKYVKEGDYVIDGGAFVGSHTVKLSQLVGSSGKVYAFEADPTTFKALNKNINLNKCTNVILFNKGIGDKPGFIQIKNKKGPAANRGGTMWEYSELSKDSENTTTEVITIDSLNLEKLNFMKLDVEGMEDKVFTGMKDTILKFKPIILYESWENLKDKSTEVLLNIHKYNIKKVSPHDYVAIP